MADEVLRTILLVEDEPSDAHLILQGLERAKVLNPTVHLTNGNDARRYLRGEGEFDDRIKYPIPALILLDLKLLCLTGIQLLQWLHVQRELKRIPLVILTADGRKETVNAAYDLGANSYLIKPGNATDIIRMIKVIQSYWMALNEPPQLVMATELTQ
ncbi:MAG TPA: response regulator [Terriglobales bacterium]|nr:response regulator [Terriglobales bacterium]